MSQKIPDSQPPSILWIAIQLAEAKYGTLGSVGHYNTPQLGGDYRGGTIGASPAYSFTAHVAEVEVDEQTGEVRLVKIWVAHDCGKAICPVIVRGQMEGSAYMGAGEALLEEHVIRPDGLHVGPSLLDYRIPTSLDVPDFEALIVESNDPEGPLGAKEAGRQNVTCQQGLLQKRLVRDRDQGGVRQRDTDQLRLPTMEPRALFDPTEELASYATAGETARAVEALPAARGKRSNHNFAN